MKKISVLITVLVAGVMAISGCGLIPTPTPTQSPLPTALPTKVPTPTVTPSPEPTATITLSPEDSAIEADWAKQKPLIDAAVASVFNDKVTSPWLWPVLNVTTLLPDSPVSHCQVMRFWDNFIRDPDSFPGCSAEHGSIDSYFGITTVPLQTKKGDNLVLKVFFFPPLPYCDNTRCILLPAPGSALYGMNVGPYQIVAACKKPSGTPTRNSMYQLLPYLKDPVSMTIEYSGNYIEIVVNRGAWYSFGWESGAGWDQAFQICPSP